MPRKFITFDPGGDFPTSYNGTWTPSGGYEGGYHRGYKDGSPRKSEVKFYLPSTSTITYVAMAARGNDIYEAVLYRNQFDFERVLYYGNGSTWRFRDVDVTPGVAYRTFNPGENININEIVFRSGTSGFQPGDLDHLIIDYIPSPYSNPSPCSHDGQDCQVNWSSADSQESDDPISLLYGEKRERVTDLVVNSATEPLTFTRTYRQNKHNQLQFMGLGWSHNHRVSLDLSPSIGDLALNTGDGGQVFFTETSPGSDEFVAVASGAKITVNGSNQYVLEGIDKSIRIFDDSTGRLLEHLWVSGEKWTYQYYDNTEFSGDFEGLLHYVTDDDGRGLQFTYKDLGSFDEKQVFRVGDLEATGLQDGETPGGRFVQFTYIEQHDDGDPVTSSPKPLLQIVRDVRGQNWTYRYYGSEADEYQADDQADYLVEVIAPDNTIVKKLTYTFVSGILTNITEELGGDGSTFLKTVDYTFQPNQRRTLEIQDGRTRTHRFWNNMYLGTEDEYGDRPETYHNSSYRPSVQFDAKGVPTKMDWSTGGTNLTKLTDANNKETLFTYDANNRQLTRTEPDGLKTHQVYNGENRQPTLVLKAHKDQAVDTGIDVHIDSDDTWAAVGSPTKSLDNTADSGDQSYHITADTDEGIEKTGISLNTGGEEHTFVALGRVYLTSTQNVQLRVKQGSTLITSTDVNTHADYVDRWQTVRAKFTVNVSSPTNYTLQFVATENSTEFYADTVHLVDLGEIQSGERISERIQWQESFHDDRHRLVEEVMLNLEDMTPSQQSLRSYHSSGDGEGLLHKVSQIDLSQPGLTDTIYTEYTYDSVGREIQVKQGSTFGACEMNQTTYDDAGNVLTTKCIRDTTYASDPAKSPITTYTYDSLGRQIAVTTYTGVTGLEQTTRTVLDALGRPVKTIENYVQQGSSEPEDWTWNNNQWEYSSGQAVSHGTNNDENIIISITYNDRGQILSQRDVLGRVTLLGYDEADRLVKSVQNASAPNGSYAGDLSDYPSPSSNLDEDLILTQAYDANGNLVKVVDPLGNITFSAYDKLNRPVRVIANAENDTYDATNGLDGYPSPLSDDPALDLEQTTTYDEMGRVIETTDVDGRTTRTAYDLFGRPMLTINNFLSENSSQVTYDDPSTWVWNADDKVWKDGSDREIEHGLNSDENLITQVVYDDDGRVQFTLDGLGHQTRYDYDGYGRPVVTITNFVPENSSEVTYDEPATWTWDAANSVWKDGSNETIEIEHGVDNDENIIRVTVYNEDGQVYQTIDVLGNSTLIGYDTFGRQVRVIQSASAPTGTYDTDLSNYSLSTDPDKDIVSDTVYDDKNRVIKSTEVNGTTTIYGYDGLDRQVAIVQNAASPSAVETDADLSNYDNPNLNLAPDKDIMTRTVYDVAGRMLKTEAVHGTDVNTYDWLTTLYGYDLANRQITVIRNATLPGGPYEPDLSDYVGSSPAEDQDRQTFSQYDRLGRLVASQDERGNVTLYGYDAANRRVRTVRNASTPSGTYAADLSNYTASSSNTDQDRKSASTYDKKGRILTSFDENAGVTTRNVYDGVGRRLRSVRNYQGTADPANWSWDGQAWMDGSTAVVHGADNDENIISDTVYDPLGRVVATRDPRGTLTTFNYDQLGRRQSVTRAAETTLETTDFTCLDPLGRMQRQIANWQPAYEAGEPISPNAQTNGEWDFQPSRHGSHNDRNIIRQQVMDALGRPLQQIDPLGNVTSMNYRKDGLVEQVTDANGVPTRYRYDQLGRRELVVQSYTNASTYTDPADPTLGIWSYDEVNEYWEDAASVEILHGSGSLKDENIIVKVEYDKSDQVRHMTDPNGHVTSYQYDRLRRRTRLTNADNKQWDTTYSDVVGGKSQVVMSYPNSGHTVERNMDRLGRLEEIVYAHAQTPDVAFSYNAAGQRSKMTESVSASPVRETTFSYDDLRRLTQVQFDADGDGTPEQAVSYAYDRGGLRTQLTMPGLTVTYRYDAKGRLTGLTDDNGTATRTHTFFHDDLDRHVGTQRPTGLTSDYTRDRAGRLLRVRHRMGQSLRAAFEYSLDALGNRVKAVERTADENASSPGTVYDKDASGTISYGPGDWTDDGDFKKSTKFSARLTIDNWTGQEAWLTVGTGPDHSIFDVYIGGSFWQSFDGYATDPGERLIHIPVNPSNAPNDYIEIRNRADRNRNNDSGYVFRFKQLQGVNVSYTDRVIDYDYDKISRLLTADYDSGARQYAYQYDPAGNRTQQQTTIGITTTTSNWAYNADNTIYSMQTGGNPLVTFSYDDNGNLTDDGSFTYTYDRANRVKSVNNGSVLTQFAYDGNGDRHRQQVGSTLTDYLLDLQPNLALVLKATTGAEELNYLHDPMGAFSVEDDDAWFDMLHDGLGSIRAQMDDMSNIAVTQIYDPYGVGFDSDGTFVGDFGFAGEQIDSNGLSYNRARTYNPALGAFTSLDPFEGVIDEPMSLNGYTYAHNNPVNHTDPSGRILPAIAGALFGGIAGGLVAGAFASKMYDLAKSGSCGCQMKNWADKYGRTRIIAQGVALGAITGAAFGALATVPWLSPILIEFGIAVNAVNLRKSVLSLAKDINNKCKQLEFVASIAGLVASGAAGFGAFGGPTPPSPVPVLVTGAGGTTTGSAAAVAIGTGSVIDSLGLNVGVLPIIDDIPLMFSGDGYEGSDHEDEYEDWVEKIEGHRSYGNPKSVKIYGHSEKEHGRARTIKWLIDVARGKNTPQGQWQDDMFIVEAEQLSRREGYERWKATGNPATDIDMGKTIGHVVHEDGTIIETTWARVVRKLNPIQDRGFLRSAFPILKE